MENQLSTLRLRNGWTLLGCNLFEWILGLVAILVASLFVESPAKGFPLMLAAGAVVTFGLARLRWSLYDSNNVLLKHLMYVWDIGDLKRKLISPEGASTASCCFVVYLLLFEVLGMLLIGVLGVGETGVQTDEYWVASSTAAFIGLLCFFLFVPKALRWKITLARLFPILIIELHLAPFVMAAVILSYELAAPAESLPLWIYSIPLIVIIWRSARHMIDVYQAQAEEID
jgi:hypothetical protein